MRVIKIKRPVTCQKLADAIGVKNFEIMRFLIKKEIFVAPFEVIDEDLAQEYARSLGFEITFQ